VTGAKAFEALEDTAAEPTDPAPEDPPLEGADPSVEGAGLAEFCAGAGWLAAVASLGAVALVGGVESLAGCAVVAGAGGWADLPGADAWSTVAAAPVTALSAEPTTELAALVTEPTALVSGLPEAEVPAARPVTAEAVDVVAEFSPGCSSCVAACACLEKISRRKRIPAATIANCAARTAARFASSCGIDSSYPRGTSPYTTEAAKAPDNHARPVRTRRSVRPPPYIIRQ